MSVTIPNRARNKGIKRCPFGMLIEERSYTATAKGYRFGFNGMEKDNEVQGDGNSLDFGARIYDSRLGRWMSVDPLQIDYPKLSPYNFAGNNPIIYIDPDGKKISWAELTDGEITHIKAQIEILKGSEIFATMYEALEASSTVITFKLYEIDSKSDDIKKRAGGYKEGNEIGWGNTPSSQTLPQYNDGMILGQEMFHMYQGIDENKELYKDISITDIEAEGEVFTFYLAEQLSPNGRNYFPKQGFEMKIEEGKPNLTFLDVFNYGNDINAAEVQSSEFNTSFQQYKSVFMEGEKNALNMGVPTSRSYHGPITDSKAVGLSQLVSEAATPIGPRQEDGTF